MFNCKSVIFFVFFLFVFLFFVFYDLLFLCFISNINNLLNFVKKIICFFYIFYNRSKVLLFLLLFYLATNNLQTCFFHCLTVYKKTPHFFINSFSCVSVVLLFFIIIDTYTCKNFFIFVWFFCF